MAARPSIAKGTTTTQTDVGGIGKGLEPLTKESTEERQQCWTKCNTRVQRH